MTRIVNLRKLPKETEKPKIQAPEPVVEPVQISKPETVETHPVSSPALFNWEAPSFYHNPKKKYLVPIVISLMTGALGLLFYRQDTLLAIFLMLSSFVLILYSNRKPGISRVNVDQSGVSIDDNMYYYKELKSFWIDYNPAGLKELSLESKKWYLPHIKVSLEKENPVELRSLMVNFVPERMHEQSLVDHIARRLGI